MNISKFSFPLIFVLVWTLMLLSCTSESHFKKEIVETVWGKFKNKDIYLYTLKNSKGAEMKVTNYGAIIVSLTMPDRDGKYEDIVLGYDNLESYIENNPYFGAIVGRFGNRIDKGKFKIGNNEYQLSINDGENHLHGGSVGFDKVVWEAEVMPVADGAAIKLNYLSKDGEQGYPGNFQLSVIYQLTNENELVITYNGTTDKNTIANPTHHSYFNLSGNFETILDHALMLKADNFTPIDKGLIPTGEILAVENTPMDFRVPKKIGEDLEDGGEQLKFGLGYDHNWVLNDYDGKLKLAASLYESKSGRFMEIFTTEPGIQFYSGNFLDGSITGKNNIVYKYRSGLCLETQHFPDSPNKPNFPSVILKPGENYFQKTIYRFTVK